MARDPPKSVRTEPQEDDFQILDSCEDTMVPNSPVLAATKSTGTPPVDESPEQTVSLDALEKGHAASISPPTSISRVRRHFRDDIRTEWTDILLLFCWFTTGFLDSTIFNGMSRHHR